MTRSVETKVPLNHRRPMPVHCDACQSQNIALQSRKLLGMRLKAANQWDLIWHCGDCGAYVGTHEGTNIPLGFMADAETRAARWLAHRELDPLWRGSRACCSRREVYVWIAKTLDITFEAAHIGHLTAAQCLRLVAAAPDFYKAQKSRPKAVRHRKKNEGPHWKQRSRKHAKRGH